MHNMVEKAKRFRAGTVILAGALMVWAAACESPVAPETQAVMYTITVKKPANGMVSAGRAAARADEVITLTITPDEGYELASIRVTGLWNIALDESGDALTFVMPAEDVTVSATFAAVQTGPVDPVDPIDPVDPVDPIDPPDPPDPAAYGITINAMIGGAFESFPADAQYENGPVQLVALPGAGKIYHPGSLRVTGVDSQKSIRITQAEDPDWEWAFEMPGEDVEVDAAFMDEATEVYGVNIARTDNGRIECGQTTAVAGDTVTLTLLPQDERYRYRNGSLAVTPGLGLTDMGESADSGGRIWTFTMPEEPVSITAEFEEIPVYAITVPDLGANGAITVSPVSGLNMVREGNPVTVTLTIADPADYRYVEDSFGITKTNGGGEIGFAANGNFRWTFTMPAEDVTINALIECIPWFDIAPAADTTNGSFSITGAATGGLYAGKAREGTPITIRVTPDPGYKLAGGGLSVIPANAVTLNKAEDQPVWTFEMPGADLEIAVEFAELGLLEIYKGGARRGITIGELSDDKKYFENSIDMNAEEPGRNGSQRVIKITHAANEKGNAAQQSFGLFSDTEIDLDTVTALSFWAKANKPLNIRYVGFGDADPDRRVVYTGEAFDQKIPIGAEWKRYVVPVPASRSGHKTTRAFFFNASLALGNYVYIDDIEFIESGITVTEITIPDTYDTLLYGPTDAAKMLKGVPVKLVFSCDDGVITTLQGASNGHTLKYNVNHWLTPFIEVSGNVDFSDGVITPREKGGSSAIAISVNIDGAGSNPMTAHINDGLLLDDFEDTWSGAIPVNPAEKSGYIWHTGASGSVAAKNYITVANDEIYGGLSAGCWRPAAAAQDPHGGRNFGAKDAAGYNTLTFRIRVTAGTAASSNFHKNTVFTFGLRNGGTLPKKTDGTFFKREFTYNADGWQEVTIPLSDFVNDGLDSAAITGYALGVVDNQGAALRIALDDIALVFDAANETD